MFDARSDLGLGMVDQALDPFGGAALADPLVGQVYGLRCLGADPLLLR